MKTRLYLILMVLCLACDSETQVRNPFLQEVNFSFDLNLNLPLYNNLNNIGNPVYVGNDGVGTRGVFVMRTSLDSFFAFEASCPNHAPNTCSTMTMDGQEVTCACEDFTYSLFTGQLLNRPADGNRYYDLLFYNTRVSGNTVVVFN
ncbi:Hypothetical protein I595_1273 [Croceitalea dokdonensis DOKDO 023]|uniref:Rieske domain-containing protein n=1 Tax=Croceitalea dokdonensis DOKDO 023 TaxID=1300341 RepID=A0A0P7AH47_9FLAO|nr:hypothetical protein [Croceitalea dokdonensis]KPM32846.1 Hypothetical protein I595_1273 [Croceitalea dokdonensis DOKDO 023]